MYSLLKIWVKTALYFYCESIEVRGAELIERDKPFILACNHPNAFLDALVIASSLPVPLHFLARGDAFDNPGIGWLMKRLWMLPVYELSAEGARLGKSDLFFEQCLHALKSREGLLTFSEGLSVNMDNIRPLRKVTARLARRAWTAGIDDMQVVPVTVNYHSFSEMPKRISVCFGLPVTKAAINAANEGEFYRQLNEIITDRLTLACATPGKTKSTSALKKALLAVPAFFGFMSQYWFYFLIKRLVRKKTSESAYYDSAMFATLLLAYPVFVLAATLFTVLSGQAWGWSLLLLLPFTAWCYKLYRQ